MNWKKFFESIRRNIGRDLHLTLLIIKNKAETNATNHTFFFLQVLDDVNVGLYQPDASNSLVYSRVLPSQFLYGNHTEFRNIMSYAKSLGKGLH